MPIGYLTGENLKNLQKAGAITCLYSTSTTYEYLGDLTNIYFFDASGAEIAHQTAMIGECGLPEIVFYRRIWGESIKANYEKSNRFDLLLSAEISDSVVYHIV